MLRRAIVDPGAGDPLSFDTRILHERDDARIAQAFGRRKGKKARVVSRALEAAMRENQRTGAVRIASHIDEGKPRHDLHVADTARRKAHPPVVIGRRAGLRQNANRRTVMADAAEHIARIAVKLHGRGGAIIVAGEIPEIERIVLGPEDVHAERPLNPRHGGHDFAPEPDQNAELQRPFMALGQPADDLGLPSRPESDEAPLAGRACRARLGLGDLDHKLRALLQKVLHGVIDRVDLLADIGEGLFRGSSLGRHRAQLGGGFRPAGGPPLRPARAVFIRGTPAKIKENIDILGGASLAMHPVWRGLGSPPEDHSSRKKGSPRAL